MSKKKNVSRTIKNGSILHSRDEFFQYEGKYRKPGYQNKGNYRKVAVIDSNRRNDLAVVKLHSKSGIALPSGKACFKPFVETLDNDNRRIRIGRKFIYRGQHISKRDVSAIKKECFNNPKYKNKNKKKVRRMKRRS